MILRQYLSSPLILIFAVSFILYINTLGHEYALDDTMMITENSFTRQGFDGFGNILTNDAFVGFFGEEKTLLEGGRYRPLSQITFAIEYELFGLNPFIGHLVNTIWYALLCCLIFLTLNRIFHYNSKKEKWFFSLPFIITMLYALHPLHTEVVANIKGRDELMSMFFSIAALYFYLDFVKKKNMLPGFLAGMSFFLALLSKENALTFLAIIPLTVYYFTQHPLRVNLTKMYALLIPVLLFFFLRYNALGFFIGAGKESGELLNNPFLHASVGEKYATIFYTMGVYLKLLFFPHTLTHDYYPMHIPIVGWDQPEVILSLMIYLTLGIIAIKSLKTKNPAGYGIWFYLITFSIFSNLFFSIGTFMNERFMFMPSLGFAIVIGYYLHMAIKGELLRSKTVPLLAFILSAFIVMGFSYKTITRNKVWKNDYTLFTTDVKTSHNSAKVNVSAGGALIDKALEPGVNEDQRKQKLLQAVEYLNHGISIHPDYLSAWILLGNSWFHLNDYQKSLEAYMACLNRNPDYDLIYINLDILGKKARQEKELSIARKCFETLVNAKPLNADYYYQLAMVYEKKENFDQTVKLLKKTVEKDPGHYKALKKHGEIEGKIFGNIDQSIEYLNMAYNVKPDNLTILENLGVAYGISGDFEKSLKYFYKAFTRNTDSAELLRNISLTYRRMGKLDKAQEYIQKSRAVEK